MGVQYAKSYVDRACDSCDIFTLYDIVTALLAERDLPKQFTLFVRMWQWCCSTRSGVWQYYESVPIAEFHETADLMDQFGLDDIAARYRGGMKSRDDPGYCGDLDEWINENWGAMEDAAMSLIDQRREYLYSTPN